MIHSATIFLVTDDVLPAFIESSRAHGLWRQLARQLQPALVATDLLQNATRRNLLLTIDYFISPQAYQRCLRSLEYETQLRFRQNLSVVAITLGAFSFPPHPAVTEAAATERARSLTRSALFGRPPVSNPSASQSASHGSPTLP